MEKFQKIVEREISTLKYFHAHQLLPILSTCLNKAGVKEFLPEHVDILKEEICNEFYGCCEPEFEDDLSYDKWEMFCFENLAFQNTPSYQRSHSPYQNKEVKWLQYKTHEIYMFFYKQNHLVDSSAEI